MRCQRCGGLTIPERFEDTWASEPVVEGWRCVNCGACGDGPHAAWKPRMRSLEGGISGYVVAKKGAGV